MYIQSEQRYKINFGPIKIPQELSDSCPHVCGLHMCPDNTRDEGHFSAPDSEYPKIFFSLSFRTSPGP